MKFCPEPVSKILLREVEKSIEESKNNKTLGIDQITNEFIKNGKEELEHQFFHLFNETLTYTNTT